MHAYMHEYQTLYTYIQSYARISESTNRKSAVQLTDCIYEHNKPDK